MGGDDDRVEVRFSEHAESGELSAFESAAAESAGVGVLGACVPEGSGPDDYFDAEDPRRAGELMETVPPRPERPQRETTGGTSLSLSIRGRVAADLPTVLDHFSLPAPSSALRFRKANVRVYEQPDSQFLIEERVRARGHATAGNDAEAGMSGNELSITVKQRKTSAHGLKLLRGFYTIVAVFMGGFAFIFGLELLLFLFIDLATELGVTKNQGVDGLAFFGVLLSVPVFVYSLGLAMTIVGRFVADTWNGHPFLRTFGSWNSVISNWVAFGFFILIPFLTMIITLFAQDPDWLAKMLLSWWSTVFAFWGIFAGFVIYYECSATLYLIAEYAGEPEMTFRDKLALSILKVQKYWLGGFTHRTYVVDGDTMTPGTGDSRSDYPEIEPYRMFTGLYTRFTQWHRVRWLYKTLETPHRIWTLDEARGVTTFVTNASWSLEGLYCRDRTARTVAVVRGPAKVTQAQARSSFACLFLGNLFWVLSVAAILVWFNLGAGIVVVAVVVILLCCVPSMRNTISLFRTYQILAEMSEAEGRELSETEGTFSNSTALYTVKETFRVTTPRSTFCWALFALVVVFFFLWPLIHLFAAKNVESALLFLFLGVFAGVRHFLNPVAVLKELGTFGTLGVGDKAILREDLADVTTDSEWKAKSRLSEIVGTISTGAGRRFWTIVYFFVVLFFLIVAVAAVSQGTETTGDTAEDTLVLVNGFEYKAQPYLPYPTCQLKKGLGFDSATTTLIEESSATDNSLIDYGFLSNLGYVKEGPDTEFLLDQWFGNGTAQENVEVVDAFREENQKYNNSAAVYKLITFPSDPQHGIVSIRGTQTLWDLMADAQLWLASALFQGLRALLPVGRAWTGILHKMVRIVNVLETANIRKVSYYIEIGDFIDYLRRNGTLTNIQVTGHSLGGGLALITAAQKGIAGIGLSAPNAMLSRDTFDPKVKPEELDTLTFNIVPVGDIIPMLDDKAKLYQNIECRTTPNNFVSCHNKDRSLCEMMYSCGSGGRPIPCSCANDFGYDEPTPIENTTTLTFKEACNAAVQSAL